MISQYEIIKSSALQLTDHVFKRFFLMFHEKRGGGGTGQGPMNEGEATRDFKYLNLCICIDFIIYFIEA